MDGEVKKVYDKEISEDREEEKQGKNKQGLKISWERTEMIKVRK